MTDNLWIASLLKSGYDLENPVFSKNELESLMLTSSLKGVCFRSTLTSKLLNLASDHIVTAVMEKAIELNAAEDVLKTLGEASKDIKTWLALVQTPETEDRDFGLGLSPPPKYMAELSRRLDTNSSAAFHSAIKGLMTIDVIFWMLQQKPLPTNLTQKHPLYNTPELSHDEDKKSTSHMCLKAWEWESFIVNVKDLEAKSPQMDLDEISGEPLDDSLTKLCNATLSWNWGKILRNLASIAMGFKAYGDQVGIKLLQMFHFV
jgi:hypothetical protein